MTVKSHILESLESLELNEGMPLKLFCKARSIPPVSSYIWTRTGVGPERVVGSNQSLDIVSVTSADHGWYRCRAQNPVGSRESPKVMVTVNCESIWFHHHRPPY